MRPTRAELEALAAFAATGNRAEAAQSLDIGEYALAQRLRYLYARLEVTGTGLGASLAAMRLLGWLHIPVDMSTPVHIEVAESSTKPVDKSLGRERRTPHDGGCQAIHHRRSAA
jgi:hypothetical protein